MLKTQMQGIMFQAPRWLGAAVAAMSLAACLQATFTGMPSESDPCIPGELHCVCDANQACRAPGLCVADRCIDLPAELTSGGDGQDPTSSEEDPGLPTPDVPVPEDDEAPGDDDSGGDSPGGDDEEEDATPKVPGEAEACVDGVRNFRETDIDCGGPVCRGCALAQACRGGVDCESGRCEDGLCVECAFDDQCEATGPCVSVRCENNRCIETPGNEGLSCDDGDDCTADDRCELGTCRGEDSLVIEEGFESGVGKWRFVHAKGKGRTLWQVGPALASTCGGETGEDPALDHTATSVSNGVAGMGIGSCHERRGDAAWDCMWSPDVNVSFFEGPIVVSFWRHLHSPKKGPRERSVGVSNRVVYRRDERSKVFDLDSGFTSAVNDSDWVFQRFEIPSGPSSLAVGICYRKNGQVADFAGWTVDDFKIRQGGCKMDE